MPTLNPDALKIGYIILVATNKPAIAAVQRKAGYGASSRWTHVAGSIGGLHAVEAAMPKSRVVNVQCHYVDRGLAIKVVRRRNQKGYARYKTALWWATMNNLPYDILQFFWFPLSIMCATAGTVLHNIFSSHRRYLCSELIATGFYKENDYCFGKAIENVLPADFDNSELFEEVKDVWVEG